MLFLLGAAAHASPGAAGQPEVAPEEYAVYSTLIGEQYLRDKIKLVVIAGTTAGVDSALVLPDNLLEHLAPLSRATYDDYLGKNNRPYKLGNSFSVRVKYVIVDFGDVEKLFERTNVDDGWKEFYRLYPDSRGYVAFSRVGFDREMDEALVSMSLMCNSLCGEGRMFLMKKRDGRWEVEKQYTMWIS